MHISNFGNVMEIQGTTTLVLGDRISTQLFDIHIHDNETSHFSLANPFVQCELSCYYRKNVHSETNRVENLPFNPV